MPALHLGYGLVSLLISQYTVTKTLEKEYTQINKLKVAYISKKKTGNEGLASKISMHGCTIRAGRRQERNVKITHCICFV
jgi:hypothetical protein